MKKFQAIILVPTEALVETETIEEAAQQFALLTKSIAKLPPANINYDPACAVLHSIYEVGYHDADPHPVQLPTGRSDPPTPEDDDPGPEVA